jgi:DNA-binding HxlR family transcriptional regulator
VLYERLRELGHAGLLVKNDDGQYELTEIGRALGSALDPLDQWARRWANETEEISTGD